MKSGKILITEDELIVRMHLQRIVKELGYEVVGTAASMDEALSAAEADPPDVALMDIHLAEGTDGVETARQLRKRHDCEIIFITAYADAQTVDRTADVEASGYLVKPFSNASVRATLQTAWTSRGHRQRAREREASLTSALERNNDSVLVANERGSILFASPGTTQVTGKAPHEACGRELGEVLRLSNPEDGLRLQEKIARVLDSGTTERMDGVEVDSPLEPGQRLPVDFGIQPVREEQKPPTGILLSFGVPSSVSTAQTSMGNTGAHEGSQPTQLREVPFGSGTRLLVYSHDTFGLGHLRRCHNLVRQLVRDHPDVSTLLVTGSPMVHRFDAPPGTDYLKLPAVRKVAPEQYEARSLAMSGASIQALRSNLLLHTVKDYAPDVVLVDHSPLGMRGEMLPAMRWLKEQGRCTLILGLREIIDDPDQVESTWKTQGIYDVLANLYDHVLVYGDPKVYETAREYRFPEDVLAKTQYMNYVADPRPAAEDSLRDPSVAPLVVVTAGGGDGGAGELIEPFLHMLRDDPPPGGLRAEILTGPFVEPALKEKLRAMAEGLPASVKDFVPSTWELFREADLVLSTCGYNTMTELLVHARRSILVPRVMHRSEQLIRARRMDELGLAQCLHPEDVTPQSIGQAVRKALAGPAALTLAREVGRIPCDGAKRFSEFCASLRIRTVVQRGTTRAVQ